MKYLIASTHKATFSPAHSYQLVIHNSQFPTKRYAILAAGSSYAPLRRLQFPFKPLVALQFPHTAKDF